MNNIIIYSKSNFFSLLVFFMLFLKQKLASVIKKIAIFVKLYCKANQKLF